MTQPDLFADPPTFAQAVADYFKAHPGEWVNAETLMRLGGRYAWRTRVSDARRSGLDIRNRQRKRDDGSVISEYRWEGR